MNMTEMAMDDKNLSSDEKMERIQGLCQEYDSRPKRGRD